MRRALALAGLVLFSAQAIRRDDGRAPAASGLQFWQDGGFDKLQATTLDLSGDAGIYGSIKGQVRGQNLFFDGADAGFSAVQAVGSVAAITSNQSSTTAMLSHMSGVYPGLWLAVGPGAEQFANVTVATYDNGATTLFNNQGSGFLFRTNNANALTVDALGGITNNSARSAPLTWNEGDAGFSAVDVTSIHAKSTLTVGTIVMSAGSGTATVAAGAICVCSVDTAFLACQPAVSSTTLTVTVTAGGSNTVSYVCL